MSTVSVEITGTEIKKGKGAYFVMCQLDEVPKDGERIVHKYRTELQIDTQYPKYFKNIFKFQDINFTYRLILKLGIFQSNDPYANYSRELSQFNSLSGRQSWLQTKTNSRLLGTNTWELSEDVINTMRRREVKKGLPMYSLEYKNKEEIGSIGFTIKMTSKYSEEKVITSLQDIKKIYFDPFENDAKIINKKLVRVSEENNKKQKDLDKGMKNVDRMNNALHLVSMDIEKLRTSKFKLSEANDELTKKLRELQKVDEIHIEIDILSDSPQGINQLKRRMDHINRSKFIQRERYMELEKDYARIKGKIDKAKRTTKGLEDLKHAHKLQNMNYDRALDLMLIAKTSKQTIECQEHIIKNLSIAVKYIIEQKPSNLEQIRIYLSKLQFNRKKLEERRNQLLLLIDLHQKEVPKEEIEKIAKGIELTKIEEQKIELMEEEDVTLLHQKRDKLIEQVYNLNQKLSAASVEEAMDTLPSVRNDPEEKAKWIEEKPLIDYKIEMNEQRIKSLDYKLINNATENARTIAEHKHRIALLDAEINQYKNTPMYSELQTIISLEEEN